MSKHDDDPDVIDVALGADSRRGAGEPFDQVLAARYSRRRLLTRGTQAGALVALGVHSGVLDRVAAATPAGRTSRAAGAATTDTLTFTPIAPSTADAVVVPPGYSSYMIVQWGEALDGTTPDLTDADLTGGAVAGAAAAANAEKQFGYNCDAVEFFPIANAWWRGVIAVNHEYTEDQCIFPDWSAFSSRADFVAAHPDAVDFMLANHGVSLVRVSHSGGGYRVIKGDRLNRRITGRTPIALSGPAAGNALLKTADDPTGTMVLGTLNNCAGGATPWGTYLTAEENFDQYFGNAGAFLSDPGADPAVVEAHSRIPLPSGASDRGWEHRYPRFDVAAEPNEAFRFGWVVEIDPYAPKSMPKKRTALGRFKHENATCIVAPGGQPVIYQGDDARFEYLYKFVAAGAVSGNRATDRDLLDSGTLMVARFDADGTGEWLPLVHGTGPLTAANGFADQGDVLIKARKAADLLGATPMDRPEDVQANEVNRKVYLACTNNTARSTADAPNPRTSNRWGHIVEITEDGDDHAGTSFSWEIFILCGDPNSATGDLLVTPDQLDALPLGRDDTYFAGFGDATALAALGSPDNVGFDHQGNLWIVTDGSQPLGTNNGAFAVPVEGPGRGHLRQFMSGPVEAEVCGCEFTPDFRTLLLAIQHPGERGTVAAPTSHWPNGGASQPRPSLIGVRRDDFDKIGR